MTGSPRFLEGLQASLERFLLKSTTHAFNRSGTLRCPGEEPCENVTTHLKEHVVETHVFGKTTTQKQLRVACLLALQKDPGALLLAPNGMGWSTMPDLVQLTIK
jgi:hypothetical protein